MDFAPNGKVSGAAIVDSGQIFCYSGENRENEAKRMILTVDISNSNVVFAVMEDEKVLSTVCVLSDRQRPADEYAALVGWGFQQRGYDLKEMEGAIIASVVPSLTAAIWEAVHQVSGCVPFVVGPGVKTGLNIRLEDPTELGGDFVASAVAAIASYPMPCVIVEIGTAVALGILDRNANYVGGVIMPGPRVSQEALARGAALLPNVSVTPTASVIGKTTAASMQSGIVNGSAAMIDGLLDRVEEELGESVSVVAAGDWAKTIIPHCKRKDIVIDDDILMRGLWDIYKKNRRS
jgi:type III pantothenate kinase